MSSFCSACGTTIEGDDRFCRACGAPALSSQATAASPSVPPPVSTKTSTKAVISLILGLFIFFFPFSLVAVILGHLSLSEIRKSAGRLTGDGLAMAGLILGYIGVAGVPIMLIVAAIAIPNLLRASMAANESSSVASIRTITTAEITYSESHPDVGYTCSLSNLSDAQLIDNVLGSGQKSGYRFEISGCAAQKQGGPKTTYRVVAYPVSAKQSGARAFCADESAVIKEDKSGSGQKCLAEGAVLE